LFFRLKVLIDLAELTWLHIFLMNEIITSITLKSCTWFLKSCPDLHAWPSEGYKLPFRITRKQLFPIGYNPIDLYTNRFFIYNQSPTIAFIQNTENIDSTLNLTPLEISQINLATHGKLDCQSVSESAKR
jgi:hypothetical protein